MENKRRVYGSNVDIDPERVKRFYAERAAKQAAKTDAPVLLSGDKDLALIDAWTNYEVEHWLPKLKLDTRSRVLEPGCGTGRIAKYIAAQVERYVGVEGVPDLYDIARERKDIDQSKSVFLNLSLELEASWERLCEYAPFNRFVIGGGVLMYLNDDAAGLCIERSLSMFERHGIYYLSEPVSLIGRRLTLDQFYSDTLRADYSAIYRTPEEYMALLAPLTEAGLKVTEAREMFEEDFKGQKETRQYVFMLER